MFIFKILNFAAFFLPDISKSVIARRYCYDPAKLGY